MPSILFLASHRPNRSPSQRYRFEQYIPFLESSGFRCRISWIISEKDDADFYQKGKTWKKFIILWKSLWIRWKDYRNYSKYDIIFVQREASLLGFTWFERKITRSGAKFVFDFDDSIWLLDTSEGNKKYEWLKDPEKTARNIRHAHLVIAGNTYLSNYAKHYNHNVRIFPTTIDTLNHRKIENTSEELIIGWCGSITTIKHFEYSTGFLAKIKKKFPTLRIRVVGDASYQNPSLNISGESWSAQTEVAVINTFTIGIMPLPDDEWAKGKCGLKALSYMACEIPTVVSPVGVNTSIITHGVNGFLASGEDDWIQCIELLLINPELRKKIGSEGRKTVIEKFSVESQKSNYLDAFKSLLR